MCFFPIKATLPPEGGRPKLDPEGDLRLPCGKCNECISKRAVEWATRARHEISLHEENCFITLTYAPEHLKSNFIIKDDFQKFMKKLRKKSKKKLTYMVSYEYGSEYFRPHMHAIIFGYNPDNQNYLKSTKSGFPLFTSPEVEKLWQHGFHSIGTANEQTAYYIASYALSGKSKEIIHPITGEHVEINDTMDASKRPAIGLNFLKENMQQLVNVGDPLPRYYIKKIEEINPQLAIEYEQNLQFKLKTRSSRELYAKHINQDQKFNLQDFTFRENTKDHQRQVIEKDRLKSNWHNYVSYNNGDR